MSRRTVVTIMLIVVLLFEIAYYFYTATTGVVIEPVTINDDTLADIFGTTRVVQISDLHLHRNGAVERKLVKKIDEADPDIIFITGDFVSENCFAHIPEILCPITAGRTVIAVLGNNDHASKHHPMDTERLVSELSRIGVQVLRNESMKVTLAPEGAAGRKTVYVVGVDDNFLWQDDIFKATTNVPPDAPKILLAHSPNIIEKINTDGIHLILSGHTHGGQIALPFWGALYTNPTFRATKRLVAGLYDDDTKVYVNRGIGAELIPLRLFARPEISLFQFKKSS
jgi:predicted MPP superfamily phosphohydrolase